MEILNINVMRGLTLWPKYIFIIVAKLLNMQLSNKRKRFQLGESIFHSKIQHWGGVGGEGGVQCGKAVDRLTSTERGSGPVITRKTPGSSLLTSMEYV